MSSNASSGFLEVHDIWFVNESFGATTISEIPESTSLSPSNSSHTIFTRSLEETNIEETDNVFQMSQMWVTLRIGIIITLVTLFAFALAMRFRITHIAARCEARPRNTIYNPNKIKDPSQNKGSPFLLGWVWWVMSLSYGDMLKGIPGTGTRDGGLKGSMLTVNLDHIVLLRFNALCLRISVMAMLVYLVINLPIYFYAQCSDVPRGYIDALHQNCTVDANYTVTSYSRYTLANVPQLSKQYHGTEHSVLYVVVITSYFVLWIVLYELYHEWIDCLSMRRVYYLEMDMWKQRQKELKETMLLSGDKMRLDTDDDNPHLHNREVYIPHPEQRDTPPNVELYSVLVRGVPSKPQDAIPSDDLESSVVKNIHLDWQLSITSAFFDACVPNQPGFTSSVAAVTILPSAKELATAWNSWYATTKSISRLHFIRRRIRELGSIPQGQKIVFLAPEKNALHQTPGKKRSRAEAGEGDVFSSDLRRDYTAEVLGSGMQDDTNAEFWRSLDLGPEQIAVYSMEMSKSLAGCCPYGFCDQRIAYCSDVEKLLEMEEEAADAVNKAYEALKKAGHSAAYAKREKNELDHLALQIKNKMNAVNEMAHHAHERLYQAKIADRICCKEAKNGTGKTSGSFASEGGMESSKNASTLHSRLVSRLVERQKLSQLSGDSSQYNNFSGQESSIDLQSNGEPADGSKRDLISRFFRKTTSVRLRSSRKTGETREEDVDPWDTVQAIALEAKNTKRRRAITHRVNDGRWSGPSFPRILRGIRNGCQTMVSRAKDNSGDMTDVMARDSTYAVVTFTSRQAAIAARKCLADGRGADSFETVDHLPVPPLADSSAFNMCDCRGFTRPVTIGLNYNQKNWRRTIMLVVVGLTYVLYQPPLTWATELFTKAFFNWFPGTDGDQNTIQGTLNGLLFSSFLAILPDLYLFLANFGSNATSLVESENKALQFYWYFMAIYLVVGQSVARFTLKVYRTGTFNPVENLQQIASVIPVGISSTWLIWIIQKSTYFHPPFYLFQLLTWISSLFGAKCCARMFRGGGAGARLPYRVFVESGTVVMCSLVLAPVAPIIAPFAVIYFLIVAPLLRYAVIFTYKPLFDSGGARWPFLFEMIIISILSGQILLATMVFLKNSFGPAIMAFMPFFPTLLFRRMMLARFLDAYNDAALVQTSLLDGWGVGPEAEHWNYSKREQFRRFLVDSHKASYVPVCIAAVHADNIITAEPALVQPMTRAEMIEEKMRQQSMSDGTRLDCLSPQNSVGAESDLMKPREVFVGWRRQQFGALDRCQIAVASRDLLAANSHDEDSPCPKGERLPLLLSPRSLKDLAEEESEEEEEEQVEEIENGTEAGQNFPASEAASGATLEPKPVVLSLGAGRWNNNMELIADTGSNGFTS